MSASIVVDAVSPTEVGLRLAELVASSGQEALAGALTGRQGGRLRLGSLEHPLSQVGARAIDDATDYLIVSVRPFRIDDPDGPEVRQAFPFGVLILTIDDFGRGEGSVHPAAPFATNTDGNPSIGHLSGRAGALRDLRRRD